MKLYAQPTGDLTAAVNRLFQHLDTVNEKLLVLSEEELTEHAPGKWSKKQILGHLIDSALNNLRRFTEAQFAPGPYPIQPYDPDELVRVNGYGEMSITDLLALWTSLNRQIVRVVDSLKHHNPALYHVPVMFVSGETNTLGWLIEDYVAHLEHHLRTLL